MKRDIFDSELAMTNPFIPRIEFKAQRLARELTSGEVACATGVNRSSIERFENGTQDVLSDSFMKLLKAFGYVIVPEQLLDELKEVRNEKDDPRSPTRQRPHNPRT